jgi:hypothetical protein
MPTKNIIPLPVVGDPSLLLAMRRRLELWHGKESVEASTGLCFWYALALHIEAKLAGRNLMLQAGTAEWQRVPPEDDDGVMATHYGYVFEKDAPYTKAFARELMGSSKLQRSILPEMHVWLIDVDKHALVDPTAGHFVAQAKTLCGFDWPGPVPPETLWCPIDDVPKDGTLIYNADPDACAMLLPLIKHKFAFKKTN